PVLDRGDNAFDLHVNRLLRGDKLIVTLRLKEIDEFFAACNFLVQSDDLGMFGPKVFAEFVALYLENFDFLIGGHARIFGGGSRTAGVQTLHEADGVAASGG